MEPSALTFEEIRRAVAIYAPERLSTYDEMTNEPATNPCTGEPLLWTEWNRVGLFLAMWAGHDATRPN